MDETEWDEWNKESIKTEKTTTDIIGVTLDKKADLENLLDKEGQTKLLYTIIFILLIIILINTYLW